MKMRGLLLLVAVASTVSALVTGAALTLLRPDRTAAQSAVTPVVQTQRFELVDAAGVVRISMNVGADNEVNFSLLEAGGQARASWGVTSDGRSVLGLRDGKGVLRADMGVTAEGRAVFVARDGQGRARVDFGVEADGEVASIYVRDSAGISRFGAKVEEEYPYVSLRDAGGRSAVDIFAPPDGQTRLAIYDGTGQSRARLGIAPNGQTRIQLFSGSGVPTFEGPMP